MRVYFPYFSALPIRIWARGDDSHVLFSIHPVDRYDVGGGVPADSGEVHVPVGYAKQFWKDWRQKWGIKKLFHALKAALSRQPPPKGLSKIASSQKDSFDHFPKKAALLYSIFFFHGRIWSPRQRINLGRKLAPTQTQQIFLLFQNRIAGRKISATNFFGKSLARKLNK